MKVGIALNMLTRSRASRTPPCSPSTWRWGTSPSRSGFDSLFALEHHFTGYAMSPSPTQLLSYFAGRTKRITLGTAVIVLPWHDPIRIAEQIALLDMLSGGRCLFGFGRGAASVEYAGFRIPMEEARPRFVEAAKIVVRRSARTSSSGTASSSRSRARRSARARSRTRAPLLRVVGEPRVGRDHGQARLRRPGHHAERVAEGRRGHPAVPGDRAERRPRARGRRSSSPTSRCAESRTEAHERAVRYLAASGTRSTPTTTSRTAISRTVKGYEVLRRDGEDLRQDEGRELPARRRRSST